ncbi:MAG: hypothetical protein HRF47_18885 [Chloroflexota bacterium]|jgi:hypothetical protein
MPTVNLAIRAMKGVMQKNTDIFILLIFPLAFTAINSNWIFTPPTINMPDPWFYFSYFRYFFERAAEFPSNTHYFVERLTWIAPGYIIYHIFPPLIANYVLHLLVYYTGCFALYGTLFLLFNRRTAFLTTLFLGGYPWFLRAAGWDYTDGIGIAYLCVLIFLLTFVFNSKSWRTIFFLAGMIHASLLVTNLFWVGLIPACAVYFLVLNIQKRKLDMGKIMLATGYFLVGNFALATLCGLFYLWATGNFFFIENTLRTSVVLVDNSENNFRVMTNYGKFFPWWHALPLLVFLSVSWKLWQQSRRQKGVDQNQLAFYLMFVLAYVWLIFWHFFSNPVLIMFPYTSIIIPHSFLLFGTLWAERLENLSGRQFAAAVVTALLVLLLPILAVTNFPLSVRLQGNKLLTITLWFALLVGLSMNAMKIKGMIFAAILLLGSIYFLMAENSYVYVTDRNWGRDNFDAIIAASALIDARYPDYPYGEFRLWFRADEKYNTFFSLAAVYLYPWGSSLDEPLASKKPHEQLALADKDHLRPHEPIVILSSRSANDILKEANQALSAQNLKVVLENTARIQKGNFRFNLFFTKTETLRP